MTTIYPLVSKNDSSVRFYASLQGIGRLPAAVGGDRRWNKRQLSIRFLNGTPEDIERVKKISIEWTQYPLLDFLFVDSTPADILISFNDYGVNNSYVGKTDSFDKQISNWIHSHSISDSRIATMRFSFWNIKKGRIR